MVNIVGIVQHRMRDFKVLRCNCLLRTADLNFSVSVSFSVIQQNEEIRRQLTAQQKLIEKHKENLQKCLNVNKTLLIDKVSVCSTKPVNIWRRKHDFEHH